MPIHSTISAILQANTVNHRWKNPIKSLWIKQMLFDSDTLSKKIITWQIVKINILINKKSFGTKKKVFIRQRRTANKKIFITEQRLWQQKNTYHMPKTVFVNKKILIMWQTQSLSTEEKSIISQQKSRWKVSKSVSPEWPRHVFKEEKGDSHTQAREARNADRPGVRLLPGARPWTAQNLRRRQGRRENRRRTPRFPFLWAKKGEIIDDWHIQRCWVAIRIWILCVHFVLRTWRIFSWMFLKCKVLIKIR